MKLGRKSVLKSRRIELLKQKISELESEIADLKQKLFDGKGFTRRLKADGTPEKRCAHCHEWFDMNNENFQIRNSSGDGYDRLCKPCSTIRNKRYRWAREDRLNGRPIQR